MSHYSAVTASNRGPETATSGNNYGLLTNVNNRPKPNALKPHMMHAGASTLSAGKLPGAGAGSRYASKQGFFAGGSNNGGLMTANTNLGRLPTLGLNQIKLEEFHDEDNNMFRVHKKTEHLLVARELEREFKDLNKFEKDNLHIWEKGISTRIDRPGTIRVINSIPAFRPDHDKKNKMGGSGAQSQD